MLWLFDAKGSTEDSKNYSLRCGWPPRLHGNVRSRFHLCEFLREPRSNVHVFVLTPKHENALPSPMIWKQAGRVPVSNIVQRCTD